MVTIRPWPGTPWPARRWSASIEFERGIDTERVGESPPGFYGTRFARVSSQTADLRHPGPRWLPSWRFDRADVTCGCLSRATR
ncbi:hypothetical protein UK82_24500 [Frankia sp. ACN1ag]|nr:hypothetical protein UK82_24500 [Frankia sp. ACN1ag]